MTTFDTYPKILTQREIVDAGWLEFRSEFQSEDDCLAELFKRAAEEGVLECRTCGDRHSEYFRSGRLVRCLRCNGKQWFTANTYFHRIRIAEPWLGTTWLVERGIVFNASDLARLANIAYSTALNIFKKVVFVVHENMDADAPTVRSAVFSPIVCKRSKETPANSHPREEEEEEEQEEGPVEDFEGVVGKEEEQVEGEKREGREKDWKVPPALLGDEKIIHDLLADGALHFDQLSIRSGQSAGELSSLLVSMVVDGMLVELGADCYARPALPAWNGDSIDYARSLPLSLSPYLRDTIDDIVRFVRRSFHGISRKYLQLYLAAYDSHADPGRWEKSGLLRACMRFRAVSDDEIFDYVSPKICKISSRMRS